MDWLIALGVLNAVLMCAVLIFFVRQEMKRREQERSWANREAQLRDAVGVAAAQGQQQVERRIAEFEKAVGGDSTLLREVLLERFGGLNTGIVEQLAAGRTSSQHALGEFKDEVKG
ncbi:MAG: hypothetical protein ABFS37_02805, partial [Acidobacteriota bacterium]